MAGISFDDLIPQKQAAPTKRQAISFDDLIPQQAAQRQQQVAASGKADRADYNAAADVASSLVSGVRRGAESILGTLGDVRQVQGDIAGGIANMVGASPETAQMVRGVAERISLAPFSPTTRQVRQATNAVVGEPAQPQSVAGEYARTIGEFAPAAAAGPGGVLRKAAMAVVPAVASEAAGQATRGTEAEPYARVAGALAGGVAAAGRSGQASLASKATKEAAKGAPTGKELKDSTDKVYQQLRDAGIRYDANEYGRFVVDAARDLRKSGMRRSVAKEAFDLMDELAAEIGKSPDFDDIRNMASMVGEAARGAARSGNNTLAKAYGFIKNRLEAFEAKAPTISNTAMPKAEQMKLTRQAKDVALRSIKNRALQEIVDNADTYAAGTEAGLRNGIGNLLRSKRGKQLFKGDERAALLNVARGRKTMQQLSRFGFDITGKAGNAALIPGATAVTGAVTGNPIALGLSAAGSVAKVASPMMTERAFNQASAAIRSGNLRNGQSIKTDRLAVQARRLLAADTAARRANEPLDAGTVYPVR